MRNYWSDDEALREQRDDDRPRGRNVDSSVDAQYEDQTTAEPVGDQHQAS